MRKILSGFCLVWLVTYTTTAQEAPQAFSMEEAITYALQNSVSAKKADLDIATAREQVREVTAMGLPQINGKVEYQHFFKRPTQILPDFISPAIVGVLKGFSLIPASTPDLATSGGTPVQFGTANTLTFSATASMLVFDGSYLMGLKAARGVRDLSQRQADATDVSIKYSVRKAYLMVLIAQENKAVLQRNVASLSKILTETQEFYKSGFVEQLDVDRLQLNLANLQSELEIVERQVELAYNLLKYQMNYDIERPIALKDSLNAMVADVSETDLSGEFSADNRIELDILKRSEYLNGLNVKAEQLRYAPNLTAFASGQEMLQRNDLFDKNAAGFYPTLLVGATLNVPIFDGFSKQAKIAKASIVQRKTQLDIDAFRRAVQLEVANSRAQYRNAKQRLESQRKNVELAERILERTRTKYKSGVGSSLELTTSEQELYRTQANYMNALYDLAVAKTDLDKALGK